MCLARTRVKLRHYLFVRHRVFPDRPLQHTLYDTGQSRATVGLVVF